MDAKTREFEAHRPALEGLAYRMLGSLDDARDVVQESWLRWQAAEGERIEDPRRWLLTVAARLAVDALRLARRRRETYPGTWLPDPFEEASAPSAAERLEIDESVSIALMVALERLSPLERAAFILHDVFGHAFEEVAAMLERSPAACRQLASRARARVRAPERRFDPSAVEHERLLRAFLEAARSGDSERLGGLLAESVALHSDGGGKATALPEVLRGRDAAVAFLIAVWRRTSASGAEVALELRRFNGAPGLLVFEAGRLTTALSVEAADGRILRIFAHRNPDKLAVFLDDRGA